ncbi:MAG: hypothetical protein AB8F34_09620 [Akkermansiaceae bacterium]
MKRLIILAGIAMLPHQLHAQDTSAKEPTSAETTAAADAAKKTGALYIEKKYREAADFGKAEAKKAPTDTPQAIIDKAAIQFWQALAESKLNDTAAFNETSVKRYTMLRQAHTKYPDHFKLTLAYINGIDRYARAAKIPDVKIERQRTAIPVAEVLVRKNPDNATAIIALARTYQNLATNLRWSKRREELAEPVDKGLAALKKLDASDVPTGYPALPVMQYQLASLKTGVYVLAKDYAKAKKASGVSVAFAEAAIKSGKLQAHDFPQAAQIHYTHALILQDSGEKEASKEHFKKVLETYATAISKFPDNAYLKSQLKRYEQYKTKPLK